MQAAQPNLMVLPSESARLPRLDLGSLSSAGVPRVLRVILREQPLFAVLLWEEEENERGAEQDRDDPGSVSRVIARQKRQLRRGSNLARVLRITVRGVDRTGERL